VSVSTTDVVLCGAGPVGATFALLLASGDLSLVALDARPAGEAPRGDRTLALSHGSRLILERVGVWDALAADPGAVTPITAIDISQAGGFGVTRLQADEHGVPALGYVVSYAALQRALDLALERAGVRVRRGVVVERVQGGPASVQVTLRPAVTAPETIEGAVAVVADGSGTVVEGIARARHDYGQLALVAAVWRAAGHDGVAYERFTPEGPMALLPECDHYGLVWTLAPSRAEAIGSLDEAAFLTALSRHFGSRVGGFARVSPRRTFPLMLERARPTVAPRAVVIGNAAQQLHPVAGQGFNLGMRDAFELARTLLSGAPELI